MLKTQGKNQLPIKLHRNEWCPSCTAIELVFF